MQLPNGEQIADAVNAPALHKWMVIGWVLLLPLAHITGWVHSPVFISDLSLVALILSSGAWWVAARVARIQRDDADVSEVVEILDERIPPS